MIESILKVIQGVIKLRGDTDESLIGNNFGAAGAGIRTAAQIGNATAAADFNSGNYSAQTLRTVIATDQPTLPISINQIGGGIIGGTTYSATATGFTCAAAATDIFRLVGSATKTIRIIAIEVTATTTAGSGFSVNCTVIKRSTANTGGTEVASTLVPHDSTSAAATATVNHYTANPTLGTTVGAVQSTRFTATNASAAGSPQGYASWKFGGLNGQAIVLRGVAEQVSINFGGVTITGPIVSCSTSWTED